MRYAVENKDGLRKAVASLIFEKEMRMSEAARKAGVANSVLSRWLNCKAGMSMDAVLRVVTACGGRLELISNPTTYDMTNSTPLINDEYEPWESN